MVRIPIRLGRTFTLAALVAAGACARPSSPAPGVRPAAAPVPPSARRELILSEALASGEGPVFLVLGADMAYRLEASDSRGRVAVVIPHRADMVYRLEASDSFAVSLSPRLLNQQPPLFRAPLFGAGVMVLPSFSGEYRIDINPTVDDAPVRVGIYREEYDNVELACIRDPGTEPCRQLRHGRTGRRLGVYLAPVAAVVAYLFMTKD